MADDDGSRRPPQAYVTVSPAGLSTTTTNQVSPGTLQDILDTGDQSLIDQAMDQMGVDDLTAYLESLPSSSAFGAVSPTGGPAAERLPQERARHTGTGPFCLQDHARPTGVVPDWPLPGLLVTAVVEVGDVLVAPPVVDPDEDEDDNALNPLPRCLGAHPDRLDKPHHEDHPLER